jgi:hypothetical protein
MNGVRKRSLGVFTGVYSKEFLKKMGYRPWFPPLFKKISQNPVMPLEPVKLAFEKFKVKNEHPDT